MTEGKKAEMPVRHKCCTCHAGTDELIRRIDLLENLMRLMVRVTVGDHK